MIGTTHQREIFRMGNMQEIEKWLETTDYFKAPASTRYHGCEHGGLFTHSYTVASILVDWTDRMGLAWLDRRSPYVIGLLHDVCKINTYVWNSETKSWMHNPEFAGVDRGHGSLSVQMIEEQGFKLNEEEKACIRYHMGTWTKDIDESIGDLSYSQMIDKYHNVLWTHTADMYASQILKK